MSTDAAESSFDVFASLRTPPATDTPASAKRRRGYRLDPIVREHLISQARLLRENDIPDREIAEALGVSVTAVAAWIGRQPRHLDGRRTDASKARPPRPQPKRSMRHTAIGPQIDFDYHVLDACEVVDEPPCRSAVTIPQNLHDILGAICDATASATCELTEHGIVTHPAESDDTAWFDEPEPPMPLVPRDRWYRLRSGWLRRRLEERGYFGDLC